MASFTERLTVIIDAVTGQAQRGLAATGNEADKLNAKTTALNKVTGALGITAVGSSRTMDAAFRGASAGGLLALTAGVGRAVGEFLDLTSQVRTFQRASGTTAEESSRFVAVLDDMQISAETGSKAIFKLGREIGQGGTELRQFGVEVAKNKDGTTNLTETLFNVSDAYVNTSDAAERAALVQAAFGRAGAELIPILEQGREGLNAFFEDAESHGQIFTQEEIDQAREMELALDDLSDTLRGFALEIGRTMTPALTSLTDSLTQVLTVADEIGASKILGGTLTGAAVGGLIGGAPGAAAGATIGLGIGLNQTVSDELKKVGGPGGVLGDFLKNGLLGAFGGDGATNSLNAQGKALGEAVNQLQSAERGTKDYKTALDAAASSSTDLSRSQEDVAKQLTEAAESALDAKLAIDVLTGGFLGAVGAGLNYQENLAKLAKAQADLTEAQNDGESSAEDIAAAQREVDRANFAVTTSAFTLENQLHQLAKAVKEGTKDGQDVLAQLEQLKVQYPAAAAAVDVQIAAVQRLLVEHGNLINSPDATLRVSADTYQAEQALIRLQNRFAAVVSADMQTNLVTLGIGFPQFAEGGIVPGPIGQATLAVVHGGETVVPYGQGGGVPIVIENIIQLDGEVVARSTAAHMNRAGGPTLRQRALEN